jgi:SNF2 family DNA or RNA helicase
MKVMPFLLRRTKDEVLADLPPKIIQDRYCDLSSLQLQLYEDFSHSQAKQEVSTLVQTYGGPDVPEAQAASPPTTHVFQVTFSDWADFPTMHTCSFFASSQPLGRRSRLRHVFLLLKALMFVETTGTAIPSEAL